DHERLAEIHLRRQHADDEIRRPAGRRGHHDVDRLARIRLRVRQCGEREAQEECRSPHWMTLSARTSSDVGTLMPIALAVFRLTVNSNLLGCSIGRSPG